MALKIGQTAKLVQTVIQGEIKDTRYNKDAESLEHLVEWVGADGQAHTRWFLESELEAV